MFISHKNNTILYVHGTEWMTRLVSKGMNGTEYWAWLASVTSGDPPEPDYSGETGYTIVECTDENVQARLNQLGDYQAEGVYNIKWSDSKDVFVMTTDIDGNSVKVVESVERDEKGEITKTNYKMSHFSGDDTAKDARLLADKWANVRRDRNRKLAETDYLALSDNTVSGDMQIYRQKLRDVPADNANPDDINWPLKP